MKKLITGLFLLLTLWSCANCDCIFAECSWFTGEKCTQNLTLCKDNSTIIISGTGRLFEDLNNALHKYFITVHTIIIQEGIETISEHSFEGLSELETVVIPSSASRIYDFAFASTGIRSANLPEGVNSIGTKAFFNCSNLESVSIPLSIRYIGAGAFSMCPAVESFTIPNISGLEFVNQSFFLNGDLFQYFGNDKEYTVPDGTGTIYLDAFLGTKSLMKVNAGNIKVINDFAFEGCENLQSVSVTDSLLSIEKGAFKDCVSLESIPMGNSVEYINDGAFEGCTSLKSVTLSNSVKLIGSRVFAFCSSLSSVTLSNTLVSIGPDAFHSCENLSSITFPDSVQEIGDWAFASCTSLTNVTLPSSLIYVGNSAFASCDKVKTLDIPNKLQVIDKWAFAGMDGLEAITIPKTVTVISKQAFAGCSNLTSVSFDGIKAPPVCSVDAFYKCPKLNTIEVPWNFEGEIFCGINVTRGPEPPQPPQPSSSLPSSTASNILPFIALLLLQVIILVAF